MTSRPPITIGTLTLDDSYAPLVNLAFEYYKTEAGEIIGGIQKYTISGIVTVADQPGLSTGSNVMAKLKAIRDLGKKTKCFTVNIPGFYSGQAKLTNISIEQGSDPTWVNQGDFSIELSAPLSSIPENSLGITLNDNVTDISKSETIEIGEDAHGYVLINNPDLYLSKTFVRFRTQISLTCKPLCPTQGGKSDNVISILRRILSTGPSHIAFEAYKTWKPYLQSRSLELTTEGSVTFSSEVILLPPNSSGSAFVDIEFEYGRSYESKQKTQKISGTVTGLAEVAWSDLVTLANTSSASKLANAETVFSQIKNKLSDIKNWKGIPLELLEKPNCPKKTTTSIGKCGDSDDDDDKEGCFQPTTSTISKSRTDGIINFTFEWSTVDSNEECTDNNGKKTVVTVDIVEPQATIFEHVIPGVGTLIQNLNCRQAKTIEFTSTTTDPQNDGCTTQNQCGAEDAINAEIEKYIPKNDPNWLIISHAKTSTSNSFSIKQKFIRKCIK